MNSDKFNADPYNPDNTLISYEEICHIFEKVNMKDI